jgi:hypothetical protein
MRPQSHGSPKCENFGTRTWESETKSHLDVTLVERRRVYYKGEDGDFPQVQAMVNLVNLRLPVARPSTKSVPTMH